MKKIVSFTIEEEVLKKAKKAAEKMQRSMSWYIESLLKKELKIK